MSESHASTLRGDPQVDQVMARLTELENKPLPAHVEVFDAIHNGLQGLLVEEQD